MFARLRAGQRARHHGRMITFEQFVTSLGDHAKRCTPEELQQLHVDAHKFAEILLAVLRVRKARKARSQQSPVDTSPYDRTLKEYPDK
jgi:hypothetical protein